MIDDDAKPLSAEELAEIEARVDKAQPLPGPRHSQACGCDECSAVWQRAAELPERRGQLADDVPRLLATIRARDEQIAALRDEQRRDELEGRLYRFQMQLGEIDGIVHVTDGETHAQAVRRVVGALRAEVKLADAAAARIAKMLTEELAAVRAQLNETSRKLAEAQAAFVDCGICGKAHLPPDCTYR